MAEDEDNELDDPLAIHAKEIKPFWMKGKISELVDSDPINSQRISQEVLAIMEVS